MSVASGVDRVVLGPPFRERIWTAAVRTGDLVAIGLALAAALAFRESAQGGLLAAPVSAGTEVLYS